MSLAEQIEVFHGSLTEDFARVYVQCRAVRGGGEWSIAGRIHGPVCQGVRTLPHAVALRDLGDGPTLLATATFSDPGTWQPDLPARYNVQIDLLRDREVAETVERWLALRPLGVDRRDLRWQSKRWVLRGVLCNEPNLEQIAEFREHRAALVVSHPSDLVLQAASEQGVLLVVELKTEVTVDTVLRLARWPAVAMIVFPADFDVTQEIRGASLNILRAKRLGTNRDWRTNDWTDLIFCDANELMRDTSIETCPLPIVAVRGLNERRSIGDARSECDRLQRDLVRIGDFAGYVV
jgi:hypothetical protein